MLIPSAYAQTAATAPAPDSGTYALIQFAPLALILVAFYFLFIRPQNKRIKDQQNAINAVKKGDEVTTAGGVVGKVTKVFSNRAVVMLVTDPEYALSVKVVNTPQALDTPAVGDPDAATAASSTTTTSTTTTIPASATIPGFTPGTIVTPSTTPGVNVQVSVPSLTIPSSGALGVRETGILEGRGPSRVPIVRFIDPEQRFGTVLSGTPIVTAGGSLSLAPPDIVVGKVSRVISRQIGRAHV